MNTIDKSMRNESGLTRRQMLAGSAGLTFAFAFAPAMDALAQGAAGKLNAYVTIAADGAITILMPAPEMGQGVNTTLPLIIAEELDADWNKVKVAQAPVNPAYNHPVFRAQYQVASLTTRGYWMPLRIAGAQARRVLLDAAAAKWNVPVTELTTEPSTLSALCAQCALRNGAPELSRSRRTALSETTSSSSYSMRSSQPSQRTRRTVAPVVQTTSIVRASRSMESARTSAARPIKGRSITFPGIVLTFLA